jgi:hypothetical protein
MSSTAIVHQCSLPFPFTPAPHVDTAPETFAPFNQYPLSTPSNHGHDSFCFHSFCCYSCGSLQAMLARPLASSLMLPHLQITTALHARRSSRASVASSLCQTNTPPVQPEVTMGSAMPNRTLAACRRPHLVAGGPSRRPPSRVPMMFRRGRMPLDQADATRTSTSPRCTSATVRRRPLLARAPPAMGTRAGRSSLARPSSLGAKPTPP